MLQEKLEVISTSLQSISNLVSDLRATESEKESAAMAPYAHVKHDVSALRAASSAERQKDEQKVALLKKIMNQIKSNAATEERFYEEVGAKLAVLEALLNSPFYKKLNTAEPVEWSIESVSELKKKVASATISTRTPDYFYGYHILPGIFLEVTDNVQSLALKFQICRGVYDKIITWPIKKKCI